MYGQKGDNMQDKELLIHEVAKEMDVEPHVLRYWEEELDLDVKRNERGHRIYTKDDVEKLTYIKFLKEQGLKLKAIKTWMEAEKKGDNHVEKKVIPIQLGYDERKKDNNAMIEIKERKMTLKEKQEIATKMQDKVENVDITSEKIIKMQQIMQKLFSNVLMENNNILIREITENIRNSVTKDFDYQMRYFLDEEERREIKRQEMNKELVQKALEKEEEHYRKLDELLRQKNMKNERKLHVLKKV